MSTVTEEMIIAWREAFHESYVNGPSGAVYHDHIRLGLEAALAATPAPSTHMVGNGEPVAYVCEADIRALADKTDGMDISIASRPFPEYGMRFPLYAEPQWSGEAVRSALSEIVDYYTATESAELFREEARLLENARAALRLADEMETANV